MKDNFTTNKIFNPNDLTNHRFPKANYHTHLSLCRHGEGTIEDYCQRALELGYHTLGISDHAPWPVSLTSIIKSRRMNLTEFDEIYLPQLNQLKKVYADQNLTLLKAIEIEFLDQLSTQLLEYHQILDYLILGQHYLTLPNGNIIDIYSDSSDQTIKLYANTVKQALSTKLFKIIAHPDIYMFSRPSWDPLCQQVAKTIIEACLENQVILEMNANGIRKKFRSYSGPGEYAYPQEEFWKIVKQYQDLNPTLKVIINDDAHSPNDLGDFATEAVYQMAIRLGLNIIDKFTI